MRYTTSSTTSTTSPYSISRYEDLVKIYSGEILAKTNTALVLAFDEQTVGKIYFENSLYKIKREYELMVFANNINSLVAKGLDLSKDKYDNNIIMSERIFPLELRAFNKKTLITFAEKLKNELYELHDSGFGYGDISNRLNILLTHQGFRLIDTGSSYLREDVGETTFSLLIENEKDIVNFFISNITNYKE